MKYLKYFENDVFRCGDYVLVDTSDWSKKYSTVPTQYLPNFYIGEIIERENFESCVVKFYNGFISHIQQYDIIRKATPEEIEEFKLRKIGNKYNL